MKKISFIGIGVMGRSMIKNLMKDAYDVTIYNRTKDKALELIEMGALWKDSIKECVKDTDIIITIIGCPKDVEEVYFGSEGILENIKEGTVVIDMTTTSPTLSIKIYEEAKKRKIYALDAPVSGGDVGAKNGTLSIMVGGDKEVFEENKSIFESMGTNIIYEGKAGSGQHTKMANQIAIAGAVSGVCEAIAYGKAQGLDTKLMLDSISEGAAGSWQMKNMGPRMLEGDFNPGFYIKHFIKDMHIAKEEYESAHIAKEICSDVFENNKNRSKLEMLDIVLKMYEQLSEDGMDDLGTQALLKYYL